MAQIINAVIEIARMFRPLFNIHANCIFSSNLIIPPVHAQLLQFIKNGNLSERVHDVVNRLKKLNGSGPCEIQYNKKLNMMREAMIESTLNKEIENEQKSESTDNMIDADCMDQLQLIDTMGEEATDRNCMDMREEHSQTIVNRKTTRLSENIEKLDKTGEKTERKKERNTVNNKTDNHSLFFSNLHLHIFK